jgi:hypothetical protein
LDENFFPGWSRLLVTAFGMLSLDEVHPLIFQISNLRPKSEISAMYLKTCTAEVSSKTVLLKDCSPKEATQQ